MSLIDSVAIGSQEATRSVELVALHAVAVVATSEAAEGPDLRAQAIAGHLHALLHHTAGQEVVRFGEIDKRGNDEAGKPLHEARTRVADIEPVMIHGRAS